MSNADLFNIVAILLAVIGVALEVYQLLKKRPSKKKK